MTVCGMPAASSSHAVRRAPWSSGRVSSTSTCESGPRSQAARSAPTARAVAAGGETACVAVRERPRLRRKSSAACADIRRQRSTSSWWSARARSGVGSSRICASAHGRFTAVGRDAASTRSASAMSSPSSAASASPYAAATPIAGAPRMAISRIASATSADGGARDLDDLVRQPALVEEARPEGSRPPRAERCPPGQGQSRAVNLPPRHLGRSEREAFERPTACGDGEAATARAARPSADTTKRPPAQPAAALRSTTFPSRESAAFRLT